MDGQLYGDICDLELRLKKIIKLNNLIDWNWEPCKDGCKTWSTSPLPDTPSFCRRDAQCCWIPCKPHNEWCTECGSRRVVHADNCWWLDRIDQDKSKDSPNGLIMGYENAVRGGGVREEN